MLTLNHLRRVVFGLACIAALGAARSLADDPAGFHWKNDDKAGTADLFVGNQPVVRYVYAYDTSSPERIHDTYKVFHHVYGPGTNTIITKGPGGKYTHHRGLYVGWNKTSYDGGSSDFWHCTKGAHLKHAKFVEQAGDATHGRMTAEIHWNESEGKVVIVETRSVVVRKEPTTGGWQIDWSSKLESRRGEITLDGDRQHSGFQVRADQAVAEKETARFLRPANFPQQPAAIQVGDTGNPPPHIDLGWFAMTYELGDKRFNIEYFDNPNLPKPSLFSERPYGRFGTFFKTKISPSKPLELKYRVIVSAGTTPSVDTIQARYQQFQTELKK
jgi:hypothetical protein